MEYLNRILHINTKVEEESYSSGLPNYITSRYSIRLAWLEKQRAFFIYPKVELDHIASLKKHIAKIKTIENLPVILILVRITARQRQKLIDAEIPFIVENKQCYLPFMATVLTERCDAETKECEKLIPSAQMLLLYYIQKGQKELLSNEAVDSLNISAMSGTRAVRQLEKLGLISTYKNGVLKVITSQYDRKTLFEKSKPYLFNPVKTIKFIDKNLVDNEMLIAGESALSEYSMLNPPRVKTYAVADDSKWKQYGSDELSDETQEIALQVWRYNPQLLAVKDTVDIISLALSYMNDPDERIEEAVEEMFNVYWEA